MPQNLSFLPEIPGSSAGHPPWADSFTQDTPFGEFTTAHAVAGDGAAAEAAFDGEGAADLLQAGVAGAGDAGEVSAAAGVAAPDLAEADVAGLPHADWFMAGGAVTPDGFAGSLDVVEQSYSLDTGALGDLASPAESLDEARVADPAQDLFGEGPVSLTSISQVSTVVTDGPLGGIAEGFGLPDAGDITGGLVDL